MMTRKFIYRVLLLGVAVPLVLSVSNPEIPDNQQKNVIQQNLGPISNYINTSNDGSDFKPTPLGPIGPNYSYSLPPNKQTAVTPFVQPGPVMSTKPLQPTNYQMTIQHLNSTIPSKSSISPPLTSSNSIPIQQNYGSFIPSLTYSPQIKQNNPSLQTSIGLQSPAGQPGPTPVFLQYIPHGNLPSPLQYLQIIPTRPFIVPINPYIPQIPSYQLQQKPQTSYSNLQSLQPYSSDQSLVASSNQQMSPSGAYLSRSVPYRFFRANSGIELINPPGDLSLNTNEYLPPVPNVQQRF